MQIALMSSNDSLDFNSIFLNLVEKESYENALKTNGFINMVGVQLQMTKVGVFVHPLASTLGYELSVLISNQRKNKLYIYMSQVTQ